MRSSEQRGPMARRRFLQRGLWAGIGAFVCRAIFGRHQEREPDNSPGRTNRPRDGSELAG